jgi:hypothetical protein
MTSADDRPRMQLRLVWERIRAGPRQVRREPPGWTDWDRKFLHSVARYPLPLSPAQRATLTWVLERAP